MFVDALKETLNDEKQLTENGAVGYRTTGKNLLDLNFSVASMRNMPENEIVNRFMKAFYEDKIHAMKWLFYARDCREGIGERRLFRAVIKGLVSDGHDDIVNALVEFVPEYGRWDDLWLLLDTSARDNVLAIINEQLDKDLKDMSAKAPISLLAKWLPSHNASSQMTKHYAEIIMKELGLTPRQYRKTLSSLRSYSNVVETYMSSNRWRQIDYNGVPSRANLIYKDAFLRHDEDRRREYLVKLQRGDTDVKINAGVLFPHDIVHKYTEGSYRSLHSYDSTIEELWKALPDYVQGAGNTICVADGSGSMTVNIGDNTRTTALDVANALAIYFAERSSGQFRNKYITFSERPQLIDLSDGKNLKEKLDIALRHNEVANTNIEAVFNLVLETAARKNMTQEELPANILIISDMEFDACATTNAGGRGWLYNRAKPDKTLFETIADRYAEHGYKLPRLVFWNVNSRTDTIPVKENEAGVALVSGFSPAIVKMVLSNSTDPYECLLEQLDNERYQMVEDAIKDIVA